MKWLSAGLTFVNIATVSGLFWGTVAGGLSRPLAYVASTIGMTVAILAWLQTGADERAETPSERLSAHRVCFWLLVFVFSFFAFRSFAWLLFSDGNQLK